MQDYKYRYLYVAVTSSATLVNTQTHMDRLWPATLSAQPAKLKTGKDGTEMTLAGRSFHRQWKCDVKPCNQLMRWCLGRCLTVS